MTFPQLIPWVPRATVIQVVDGDTIHARLDIGWGITLEPRSLPNPGVGTLRAVYPSGQPWDAAEAGTELGRQAQAYARTLVAPGHLLTFTSFHLDSFGRTLAAVTLPDGRDWATTMAQAGFTKPT